MKYMKKKSLSSKAERVKKAEEIKKVVNDTQKITSDVDNITKVISNTLYMRGNVAVDLQNYSLISISNPKDII